MATSLTITAGALSRTKTAGNDTKAQEVLTRFAAARGCPPNATNAERADFILDELTRYMVAEARREYVNELSVNRSGEAEANVGF